LVRLQAYQREYARKKRAPGRRKVSKVERALLEENYSHKRRLLKTKGLGPGQKSALPPCVLLPHVFLLVGSHSDIRGYKCALIIRSRAVDPRRNESMAKEEGNAQAYFEERKDILQMFDPNWREAFKMCVNKYIEELVEEAEIVSEMRYKDEKRKRRHLHIFRRLIAGADQELELAQQPEYATKCAKVDGALIWQGRGYVILTRVVIPS
jgi:hypothetical protein